MLETPRANRPHIGIFGIVNSGKSSIFNLLLNQDISITSNVEGTTSDPVYKNMEIHKVGPITFIDTAGFIDNSNLGEDRIKKTSQIINKISLGIYVFTPDANIKPQLDLYNKLKENKIDFIIILNKSDLNSTENFEKELKSHIKEPIIKISSKNNSDKDKIYDAIKSKLKKPEKKYITGNLVKENDVVVLVMPQDNQAPEGRLILPQVQTIRELIDKNATIVSSNNKTFLNSINSLAKEPDLIITDSSIFKEIYSLKPKNTPITSFSILFAAYKGDLNYFLKGAKHIANLNENSKILIAEACTHPPDKEDIGTVKIPNLLKKQISEKIQINFTRGESEIENIKQYDLIIHCGACMFNHQYMQNRVQYFKDNEVMATNYGLTIAYLQGILDKVVYP